MVRIEYKPKNKKTLVIGDLTLEIMPPLTELYPLILELQKEYTIAQRKNPGKPIDISELDPKVISIMVEIIIRSLKYNYPNNTEKELKDLVNDNMQFFLEHIHVFLGLDEEQIKSQERLQKAAEKGDLPKN